MITVCHVITTIEMGGAEKQLLELIAEQTKSGDRIIVIFLKGEPQLQEYLQASGAIVIKEVSNVSFFKQTLKLRKLIQCLSPDLIHAHLPRSEVIVRMARGETPFLVSRHNSEPFFPRAPKVFSRLLSRFVLRRSFLCICISESVRDYLQTNNEVPKQTPLKVVRYGISLSLTTPNFRTIAVKKNEETSLFRILCVARLVPQKNIEILLEAFKELILLNKHCELRIIGKGYLAQTLREYSIHLGIENGITWVQECSEISEVMKEFDCFVLPSKYEGFGLVLLEAMKSKLPIIASNIPTSIEVLGPDYFGLFENNSSISLFLKIKQFMNPEIRQRSVSWQNQRLDRFDIVQTSKEIQSLYLRRLSGKSPTKQ